MEYKGELKGFPEAVVNRMLDCQEEQGNNRDVSVFEKNSTEDKNDGFNWDATQEGHDFWSDVIVGRNFKKFTEAKKEASIRNLKTVVDYFDSNELIAEDDDYNIEILGYVIPVSVMHVALARNIAHSTVTEWIDFRDLHAHGISLGEYNVFRKKFMKHSALTTDAEKVQFEQFLLKELC